MVRLFVALMWNAPTALAAPIADVHDPVGPIDVDRMNDDLWYAVDVSESAARRVAALPASERRRLVVAAGDLATECAFNRSTFMATFALERELAGLAPTRLDADERRRFDLLVRGVRAQADLFRSLEADRLQLPLPGDGLYLAYLTRSMTLVDGARFADAADPVAPTAALLSAVPEANAAMTDASRARVVASWDVLASEIGPSIVWTGAIHRWSVELLDLSGGLRPAGGGARLDPLLSMLATFGDSNC
jgi:hypothetical protein